MTMRMITLAAAVGLAAQAVAADRPAWIVERERLWEQVEAECGGDILGAKRDLDAVLRACRERNEAASAPGRPLGTIRLEDTKEYVEAQWGKPGRTRRMISQYGVTEWWEYPDQSVHFVDGRVYSIHQ